MFSRAAAALPAVFAVSAVFACGCGPKTAPPPAAPQTSYPRAHVHFSINLVKMAKWDVMPLRWQADASHACGTDLLAPIRKLRGEFDLTRETFRIQATGTVAPSQVECVLAAAFEHKPKKRGDQVYAIDGIFFRFDWNNDILVVANRFEHLYRPDWRPFAGDVARVSWQRPQSENAAWLPAERGVITINLTKTIDVDFRSEHKSIDAADAWFSQLIEKREYYIDEREQFATLVWSLIADKRPPAMQGIAQDRFADILANNLRAIDFERTGKRVRARVGLRLDATPYVPPFRHRGNLDKRTCDSGDGLVCKGKGTP